MARKYSIDCGSVDPDIGDKKISTNDTTEALAKFGELMIKLALGLEKVPPNRDDHNQFLKDKGALSIPTGVRVELIEQTVDNIKILVPPRELIKAALCEMQKKDDDIANGDSNVIYEGIPEAYKELDDGTWIGNGNSMEKFYEVRVCDYSLGYCR